MKRMTRTVSMDLDPMNGKPPKSGGTKKLSWPFKSRNQDVPVCMKASAFDLRPPWRPFSPQPAAFEPRSRLLGADEWGPQKTMRVCRQDLFLQRTMSRPSSAGASSERTLQCDCLSHWSSRNSSRPSTAPAGGSGGGPGLVASKLSARPKKRPAWRPGATKPGAFDASPGLLCDPGPAVKPKSSHREKMHCKSCGLRAKHSPLLRNLAIKIENLMSESPFGWCVVNP